jgi:hypothetical protein
MAGEQRPATFLTLRTRELGSVFRDTTSSYKFFWFLAIIDLLSAFERPVPVERIVRAMIVRAWAAVVLFRLSLGKVDRLQDCVRAFQAFADLPSRASPHRLDHALERWPDLALWADELTRFVPGRFLAAWFARQGLRPYDRRGAHDVAVAADRTFGTASGGPYRLIDWQAGGYVELAPGWRPWLQAHHTLALGFAEQHLVRYLQARNPNAPGIVEKLAIPQRRSLALQRQSWRVLLEQNQLPAAHDIFTLAPLASDFEVDHFLPWSFVAHDAFWNLCPVSRGVNRAKSDRLPALEIYLPRLAALHAAIVRLPVLPPTVARDYSEFLRVPVKGLAALDARDVARRYNEVVRPMAQIAANQGFPQGWRSDADRHSR